MSEQPRKLNDAGHTQDCSAAPATDTAASHNDIFCPDCHDWFEEPHVLPHGTDIAWPAGWSRAQAQAWRRTHRLEPESEMPQAGPHDRKDLANKLATAGTGMLPEPGTSDQDDMAPGG